MKDWHVLLPARSRGKTRLHAPGDWSHAFALDTIAAVANCPLVASVTILGDVECEFARITDTGTGLNNEILLAAQKLQRPLAVVLADLPTLTSEEFTEILLQARQHDKAIVVDHTGSGTTMITLLVNEFTPHFGHDSAHLHISDGYAPLHASDRARLDVDTTDDLSKAQQLGLGAHSTSLLQRQSGK